MSLLERELMIQAKFPEKWLNLCSDWLEDVENTIDLIERQKAFYLIEHCMRGIESAKFCLNEARK